MAMRMTARLNMGIGPSTDGKIIFHQGGVDWGVIASLVETCKLNALDPQAYLAGTLTRLINRHPASQIDQLMPWAYHQVP